MTNLRSSTRSGRIAIAVVAVVVVVAVVLSGIRIGQELTSRPSSLQLAAAGPLQAVYLANGTVYLGAIVGDDGKSLRLAGGAVIRSRPAASGEPGGLGVDLLSVTPFNLAGDVLIPWEQVAVIGNIQPGSAVANAYLQAASGGGAGGQPSPAPS